MSTRLKAVEVDWIDSGERSGWGSAQTHRGSGPIQCRTAGYLLKRDKQTIVIVLNTNAEGQVGESITIPASCVKKVRRLK
jgi:hypothetical protein